MMDGIGGAGPWSFELLFANESNRASFRAQPERYLPAWGGFCAYGITHENATTGWPWARDYLGPPGGTKDAWFIFNGRLYFAFMASMVDGWLADTAREMETRTQPLAMPGGQGGLGRAQAKGRSTPSASPRGGGATPARSCRRCRRGSSRASRWQTPASPRSTACAGRCARGYEAGRRSASRA